MGTERVAAQLLISGIVQGVGYRYWTTRTAARLGLAGWVRNLYDDRVEIFAEGPAPALEALVDAALGERIADDMSEWLQTQPGWRSLGTVPSPIEGGDGNREFLLGGVRDR